MDCFDRRLAQPRSLNFHQSVRIPSVKIARQKKMDPAYPGLTWLIRIRGRAEVESLVWRNNVRSCSLDNLSHSFAVHFKSTFTDIVTEVTHSTLQTHGLASGLISRDLEVILALIASRTLNKSGTFNSSRQKMADWWLISGLPGCYR